MQITSQQQLLQHITNGGLLKLGEQGKVETQSGIGRFFQNIGDKFRALSARGRATIENRQDSLRNAVTDMLRNDPKFNPVGNNGEVPPLQQTKLQGISMQITIAKSLGEVPASARDALRHLVEGMMIQEGFPGQHSNAEIQEKAVSLGNRFRNNPGLFSILQFNGTRKFSQLKDAAAAVADGIRDTFVRQLGTNSTHIKPNGLHDSYAKDAGRGAIGTVNGHVHMNGNIPRGNADATLDTLEREFSEFVPEQFASYKPVISMLMSQAGIVGSLAIAQERDDQPSCLPNYKDLTALAPEGFSSKWVNHLNSVSFEGSKAIFHCDTNQRLSAMGESVLGLPHDVHLAENHYSMTLEMDMSEPWQPGRIPDFTCTDFSVTPTTITED